MAENNAGTKTEQVAHALSGLIADRDRFVIEMEAGEIVVRPISDKDSLKALNPDLHGRLLGHEQKMLGTGHGFWLFLLGAIAANLIISKDWLHRFGLDLSKLQSWWVYVGMFVLAFVLSNVTLASRVKERYKEHSDAIRRDIRAAGLTTGQVISMTEKDSSLFNVRQHLMLD